MVQFTSQPMVASTFTQVGSGGVGGSTADKINVAYTLTHTLGSSHRSNWRHLGRYWIYMWSSATSTWLNVGATIASTGFSVSADGTMYSTDCVIGNGVWRSLNYNALDASGASISAWAQVNNVSFPGGATTATIGTANIGFPSAAGSKMGR